MQYANLQTRYYALEVQHRALAKQAPGKRQQQQQQAINGAAAPPDGNPAAASKGGAGSEGARVLVTRHRKAPGSLGARAKASLRRCNSTGAMEVTQRVPQDGANGTSSDAAAAGTESPHSNDDWGDASDVGTSSDTSDVGDAGDTSSWRQRCRELQAANRQLRQQLIRVAHPDTLGDVSSSRRGAAADSHPDQQLVQSLQAQLAAAQAAAAAAQAAAVEAQQRGQQQGALAVVAEGGSWRRALEAAVAEEQERWQQRVAGLEQVRRVRVKTDHFM